MMDDKAAVQSLVLRLVRIEDPNEVRREWAAHRDWITPDVLQAIYDLAQSLARRPGEDEALREGEVPAEPPPSARREARPPEDPQDVRASQEDALELVFRLARIGLAASREGGQPSYEIAFLLLLGMIHTSRDDQEAVRSLIAARELARGRLGAGVDQSFAQWAEATFNLGQLERDRGDLEEALELFKDLIQTSRLQGSLGAEAWGALGVANALVQSGQLEPARDYAIQMAGAMVRMTDQDRRQFSHPDRLTAYGTLFSIARDTYYGGQDPGAAVGVAEAAVELAPERPEGYFILGNALPRDESARAAEIWSRAIAVDPTWPSFHFNYGGALTRLERMEEAIVPLDEAVRLRPDSARYRFVRAQVLAALERYDEALGDYAECIRLATSGGDDPERRQPRTREEYEQNMPARDMADFARLARVKLLLQVGRKQEAVDELQVMIRDGDPPTMNAAYMFSAEIREGRGDREGALADLTAAVEVLPGGTGAREQRAGILTDLGRYEEALRDLAELSGRERDPEAAIKGLDRLIESAPNLAEAFKWRGFAYFESYYPGKAVEDLTRAIEAMPKDPRLHYLRGLAWIMQGIREEDKAWNDGFNLGRVLKSLDDLGIAVCLAPDDADAVSALKWLVDRVTADDHFLEWFHFDQGDHAPATLIPGLREAIALYYKGMECAERRDWAAAIERYEASQACLGEAGLPVFACRLHLPIADNYLRLYQTSLALEHLSHMPRLMALQTMPVTRSLREISDRQVREGWLKGGRTTLTPEIDFLPIYSIGFTTHMQYHSIINAEALGRQGDYRGAVRALGTIKDFLKDPKFGLKGPSPVRNLLPVVIILRDGGRPRKALKLLRLLAKYKVKDKERLRLFNTIGTVYLKLRRLDPALKWFRRTLRLADRTKSPLAVGCKVNIATIQMERGQPGEALQALNGIDPDGLSIRDQFGFYMLRARGLVGVDRVPEAQKCVLRALDIADVERSQVRLSEAKRTWQSARVGFYAEGLLICLANGDTRTAYEVVERSKARTFVDQLEIGHPSLPGSAGELLEVERNLLATIKLLRTLAETIRSHGPSFVDYTVMGKLQEFRIGTDLFEDGDGDAAGRRLSAEKVTKELTGARERLREVRLRIEGARLASVDHPAGRVLGFDECRQLLQPS
jgi:tetratricopeptide (TPR) repeat protein